MLKNIKYYLNIKYLTIKILKCSQLFTRYYVACLKADHCKRHVYVADMTNNFPAVVLKQFGNVEINFLKS